MNVQGYINSQCRRTRPLRAICEISAYFAQNKACFGADFYTDNFVADLTL